MRVQRLRFGVEVFRQGKKRRFLKTFHEALGRLDNPASLGYSSAVIVVEVGKSTPKFSIDDRVIWIGAAAGSLFVFKGKYRAVLINYPTPEKKKEVCKMVCGIAVNKGDE